MSREEILDDEDEFEKPSRHPLFNRLMLPVWEPIQFEIRIDVEAIQRRIRQLGTEVACGNSRQDAACTV